MIRSIYEHIEMNQRATPNRDQSIDTMIAHIFYTAV